MIQEFNKRLLVHGFLIFLIFGFVSLFFQGCSSMPTIHWKSDTQKQVAKLAVSIGAKAIGLKLVSTGFMWTDEIEGIYKFVRTEDKFSLDAAQMAEGYIRDNVDPLVAPDILELAKMVGFEFDNAGHVIGTAGVDSELLKTAADGFRLAVTTRQKSANDTGFPELTGPFYPEGAYYPIPNNDGGFTTLLPFVLVEN